MAHHARKKTIPLFKVFMSREVDKPLLKTLHSGYIGQGPKVEEFEGLLKKRFNNPYLITLSCATHGLHLAAILAGITSGDEVITTSLSCTATNWPFIYEKAKLVWADVKADDLNIDPESIKKRITNKTKAIVVMDWGGYPCDLEKIQKIGQENGVPIIEDASQSFGATYKDSVIGDCKFVDYTIISFQAIKQLTTVDGGMLSMRTEKDYKRGKLLRWYGMDRDTPRLDFRCEEDVAEVGYKYHMNDVAATIGIEQLKYVDAKLEKTKENIEYYRKKLLGIPGISLLQNAQDRQGSGWLFTILVENQTDFMRKMEERNIQVSRVHERNDKHTCMSEFKNTDLPVLNSIIKQMVAIPAGWWVSEFERNYILWCIKDGW